MKNLNEDFSIVKNIANLLFEAQILKNIPRAGFHFLGAGKESVAEHSFSTTFVAYVMSQITPDVDALRLINMCLVHDLPETRIGDLNYVHKKYTSADEKNAVRDITANIPFGQATTELIEEFNKCETMEAKLACDADQISFILELKTLSDIGYKSPDKWLPIVIKRVKTEIGKKLVKSIMETKWDTWWTKNYDDNP